MQVLYDDSAASQQLHAMYGRNGYVKTNRPRHVGKTAVHPVHSSLGQQQQAPPHQQMYIAANPNGLASAIHNLSLVDANEVGVGNTDDEASSGESLDGTPPDTPRMRDR